MKRLLVIKTGTTFPSILKDHGDFEDFIINQTGLSEDVTLWHVYRKEQPPSLADISGIVITGSHSMVSDFEDWSVLLSDWLKTNANKSIPTLGICYGHQLIAQAFGGQVAFHPNGKEIGTVKISLTNFGTRDPLLNILPANFLGHVTHAQTVVNLPSGARCLARNSFEQHHAFVYNDTIWGVQFHPEFNAAITKAYITEQKETLITEDYDVENLQESVQEHEYGKLLLKRFLELLD